MDVRVNETRVQDGSLGVDDIASADGFIGESALLDRQIDLLQPTCRIAHASVPYSRDAA
jgi:hypothetical protein